MDKFITMPLRISIMLAERIDDFWHEHRFKSRAEAVRVLLERGLRSDDRKSDDAPPEQDIQQYKHEDQRKDHLHDQAERRRERQERDDVVDNTEHQAEN
jgi:metal-responsive CopG/Arc/MetJ family transcriptional regulator